LVKVATRPPCRRRLPRRVHLVEDPEGLVKDVEHGADAVGRVVGDVDAGREALRSRRADVDDGELAVGGGGFERRRERFDHGDVEDVDGRAVKRQREDAPRALAPDGSGCAHALTLP
jgi:hypothetical protein